SGTAVPELRHGAASLPGSIRLVPGYGIRPWLYGIAARQIGRHRRREVQALKLLARTGHDPVADSWTDSADDRLAAEAAARLLAGVLARLSAGDRHVLLLFAWADLGYQVIAEALGIPVGSVCSRLSRARRKLRTAAGPVGGPHIEARIHEGDPV
ncbi:sigma-70 family RNA polymerase sigma factor, partial [Streptomyces iakyrus]|uniref:RNA polymerase sigma factor n=1 Tax=Streptomyces iakyrus TaxID=68219 RepID=UPI0033B94E3B